MSFRDFVHLISSNYAHMQNEHWLPQVSFLVFREYSRWYCVEQFDDAVSQIRSDTGFEIFDTRDISLHSASRLTSVDGDHQDESSLNILIMKKNGLSPSYHSLYDDEIVEIVKNLYRDDIELYAEKMGREGLLFS